MKKTPGLILWDFDGTLGFRQGGWAGALVEAAGSAFADPKAAVEQIRPYLQSGFPWHAPECEHAGLSADEWWLDQLPVFLRAYRSAGVDAAAARALAQKVRPVYLRLAKWRRFPDSLAALEQLSAAGWQHVLLTNHVPELPSILDHLELAAHFQAVFNSAETGWEKPNGHAFQLALKWAEGNASARRALGRVVVVGDSPRADGIGAREAGLKVVRVRQEPAAGAEFPCIKTLEPLPGLLQDLFLA